jgi:hypothetical protein
MDRPDSLFSCWVYSDQEGIHYFCISDYMSDQQLPDLPGVRNAIVQQINHDYPGVLIVEERTEPSVAKPSSSGTTRLHKRCRNPWPARRHVLRSGQVGLSGTAE